MHAESVARPITPGPRKLLALEAPDPNWSPAPSSEVPVALGDRIGGRYVVDRLLGSGGMGVVCLGTHVELEQRVAIKFMRETFAASDSLVQRFLNEARIAATLKSEHVVRVVDVGQLDTGLPYLVMEHLEGTDLDALLVREGPFEVKRALRYGLEVCDALAEAHERGIVHRDIKPENLFLATVGSGRHVVKVLDFGLAKRLDSAVVVTGPQDSMGSPCYMSPEQISAPQDVDARTDVWSLGVVLYRLLTGAMPFDGASVLEVYARVLNAPQKPIHAVRPGLDPNLDVIVGHCLEKDPAKRFGSITDLAAALTSYLAGVTSGTIPAVEAPAPVNVPVVRARGNRGRRLLLAAVAVAAILGGFAVGRDPDTRGEARARLREFVADARDHTSGPARAMLDDASVALALPVMAPETEITKSYEPPLAATLGVTSRWPARGPRRERLLAAEKERDMTALAAGASNDSTRIDSDENDRRLEAYGEFLQRQGLTWVAEAPETTVQAPAPAPASPPPGPPVRPPEFHEEASRNDLKAP